MGSTADNYNRKMGLLRPQPSVKVHEKPAYLSVDRIARGADVRAFFAESRNGRECRRCEFSAIVPHEMYEAFRPVMKALGELWISSGPCMNHEDFVGPQEVLTKSNDPDTKAGAS